MGRRCEPCGGVCGNGATRVVVGMLLPLLVESDVRVVVVGSAGFSSRTQHKEYEYYVRVVLYCRETYFRRTAESFRHVLTDENAYLPLVSLFFTPVRTKKRV